MENSNDTLRDSIRIIILTNPDVDEIVDQILALIQENESTTTS